MDSASAGGAVGSLSSPLEPMWNDSNNVDNGANPSKSCNCGDDFRSERSISALDLLVGGLCSGSRRSRVLLCGGSNRLTLLRCCNCRGKGRNCDKVLTMRLHSLGSIRTANASIVVDDPSIVVVLGRTYSTKAWVESSPGSLCSRVATAVVVVVVGGGVAGILQRPVAGRDLRQQSSMDVEIRMLVRWGFGAVRPGSNEGPTRTMLVDRSSPRRSPRRMCRWPRTDGGHDTVE